MRIDYAGDTCFPRLLRAVGDEVLLTERYEYDLELSIPPKPLRDAQDLVARSRVIRAPAEQVNALPRMEWGEASAILVDMHLPLNPVLVDIAGAVSDSKHYRPLGCVFYRPDDSDGHGELGRCVAFPFVDSEVDGIEWMASLVGLAVPAKPGEFNHTAGLEAYRQMEDTVDPLLPLMSLRPAPSWEIAMEQMIKQEGDSDGGLHWWREVQWAGHQTMERALQVLVLLESLYADLEPQRLPRQQRREAERKNKPIPMEVVIRSHHAPKRDDNGAGEHIDFNYRFEVRGHWKHFGPDTQLFKAVDRDRPEKIIDHPIRGPVVRVWCPPFVKGPDDKPFVPKRRILK